MTAVAHAWGPHKAGIRWVQCQVCECLLHDPEADGLCPGDPAPILERRARDAEAARATFAEIGRREEGGPLAAPMSAGLWQTLPAIPKTPASGGTLRAAMAAWRRYGRR